MIRDLVVNLVEAFPNHNLQGAHFFVNNMADLIRGEVLYPVLHDDNLIEARTSRFLSKGDHVTAAIRQFTALINKDGFIDRKIDDAAGSAQSLISGLTEGDGLSLVIGRLSDQSILGTLEASRQAKAAALDDVLWVHPLRPPRPWRAEAVVVS